MGELPLSSIVTARAAADKIGNLSPPCPRHSDDCQEQVPETDLDGVWRVERTGGLLPPLIGVRKVIAGDRGETRIGRVPGVPFRVDGNALRYRRPFAAFVDLLERDELGYKGSATVRGHEFGRFVMRRISGDA